VLCSIEKEKTPGDQDLISGGFLVVILHFNDGVVRALVQAAKALDALFLIDDEFAVPLADGLFPRRSHYAQSGPVVNLRSG
jgi:hypothetical protein